MSSAMHDPIRDDRFDRFDGEIRRFLEWDSSQIDGAPSRAAMLERLLDVRGLVGARRRTFGATPTMRVLIAVGLLLALLGGAFAAGAYWEQRAVVVAPTPKPTVGTLLTTQVGAVAPGTYWATARTSVPFTLHIPGGWQREWDGNVHAGDPWAANGVAFNSWLVTQVYSDACHWQGTTLRETGSRAELVAALVAQKGHALSPPNDVTFGGLPATRLDIVVPTYYDGTGCDDPDLRVWPNGEGVDPDILWVFAGETITIYIVDGDVQPTAFYTIRKVDSYPADVAALEAIVESVQFQP